MRYQVRIEVSLKPGHSDPEGETATSLLRELGYRVRSTSLSKVYTISMESSSKKGAEDQSEEICKRLLANPTKDNYRISVEEEK